VGEQGKSERGPLRVVASELVAQLGMRFRDDEEADD
jgi:hypothetical protein